MEVSQAALDASRHAIAMQCADQLRDGWICRCLAASSGKTFRVLAAMLFAEFAEHMRVILRIAYPGFVDLELPLIMGYGVITDTGKVIARVKRKDGSEKVEVIYNKEDEMLSDLRRMADQVKINDDDRRMLFRIAQKWIVLDKRIDHMGERKAS